MRLRVHAHQLVIVDQSPAGLATLYAEIGRQMLLVEDPTDAFTAITRTAVDVVPGAEWASVTWGRTKGFTTLAATDPGAAETDGLQYSLNSGPCLDAIRRRTTLRSDDLRVDRRWPEFGRRAAEATGAVSMLSHRLFLDQDDVVAGLNLYSTAVAAFDGTSEMIGTLVATHGALAVAVAHARQRAAQLQQALESSRSIGIAMGVLMATQRVTRTQAFELLRVASHNTNRKVADVALDIVDTGALDLPRASPPRRTTD